MSEALAIAEQELRSRIRISPRPDLLADSFPEQRAFVQDTAPLKAAFCTRRAAKSYSVG